MNLRSSAVCACLLVVCVVSRPASTGHTRQVVVTSANEAGPGSFRAANAQANGNPAITVVQIAGRVRSLALRSTVEFSGAQDLGIDGNHATLDGAKILSGEVFRATGGGDLVRSQLTVRNAPAEGITVQVLATATGTLKVSLFQVDIADNHGHDVLVNDQVDSTTQDGVQPAAACSDASLAVPVVDSRFLRNGFSVSDRHGLRVNEGGLGAGTLVLTRVTCARMPAAMRSVAA